MSFRDLFLRRPEGEISVLRQPHIYDGTLRLSSTYTVDSSKVNYELARELYRNTNDNYKLGAAFAKPIVNTLAGFAGSPKFVHEDKNAQEALDQFFGSHSGRLLRVNRNCFRDGDVYVQIYLKMDPLDREPKIALRLIPPEWCSPSLDPLTGELSEFVIKWPVTNYERDANGELREMGKYVIRETLTPKDRTLAIEDGSPPDEVRTALQQNEAQEAESNNWGFIPIVHFKNEAEENQRFGSSDLEPVEPFMRAYHDVMLYAAQGAKMFARPKARFSLKSVATFLKNNFTEQQIASKRLPFQDKEIFFMGDTDTAEFITADSGMSGVTTLLEFFYYCIVDVSQTPEFAFGTAVASSKASVSEQMPVLARNIRRKRGELADPYRELASMYLNIAAQVLEISVPENKSYRTEIDWDEVSPRDESDVASTLSSLVVALRDAVDGSLMSIDAAVEFLGEFVPSMLPFLTEGDEDDEFSRIVKSKALKARLESGEEGADDELEREEERPELEVVAGGGNGS